MVSASCSIAGIAADSGAAAGAKPKNAGSAANIENVRYPRNQRGLGVVEMVEAGVRAAHKIDSLATSSRRR